MGLTRILFLLSAALLAYRVVAQPGTPVNVVNTPGVIVQNTPGVTLVNVPGVTIENNSEFPVSVDVVESVENDPQSIVEYRVVGYTRTRPSGRVEAVSSAGSLIGYAAMHELCAQEVASNARAAFTSEALLPVAPLFGQVRLAWVIPSSFAYDDPAEIARITCDWHEQNAQTTDEQRDETTDEQTAYATGLVFAPSSGRVTSVICETALPIACSAPVTISVTP